MAVTLRQLIAQWRDEADRLEHRRGQMTREKRGHEVLSACAHQLESLLAERPQPYVTFSDTTVVTSGQGAQAATVTMEMNGLSLNQLRSEESSVAGIYMDRSIADFRRACEAHIAEEQRKPSPDTALIALLCDAVRCSRELTALATKPVP